MWISELLDAFDADYIPEHMLTREFLQEVKSIMAPGGVIVANTFSDSALYVFHVTRRETFVATDATETTNEAMITPQATAPAAPLLMRRPRPAFTRKPTNGRRGISSNMSQRPFALRTNWVSSDLADRSAPPERSRSGSAFRPSAASWHPSRRLPG